MPQKKKKKSPAKRRRSKFALTAIAAALSLILGLTGWMLASASVVRLRYATVEMEDLPKDMAGTKILFMTDFDLCGLNTPARLNRFLRKLDTLQPDMVLLGGDYTSLSLLERLNNTIDGDIQENRIALFRAIAEMDAPLGIYAISGDNDTESEALQLSMAGTGIQLIDNRLEIVTKGGASIGLVGLSGREPFTGLNALAGKINADQCVIALAHSPETYASVQIAEAAGGGAWADLVLAGHTHGGQINLFGRELLSLSEREQKYLSGWYSESGLPLLVSQGIGCEGAGLRLGSSPEVWMITLECPDGDIVLPDLR